MVEQSGCRAKQPGGERRGPALSQCLSEVVSGSPTLEIELWLHFLKVDPLRSSVVAANHTATMNAAPTLAQTSPLALTAARLALAPIRVDEN